VTKPVVIDVQKVSMAYKMYARPIDMLKEIVLGGERHETFWALRNIDLVVNEGDRIGIVGPNGAGKSTLLKIIAGNLTATSGRVEVHGRVSSLLSMVPAWNEEETGIENIRFNLLVKGVPERRIAVLTDEIVDFTELGPFIFHPVRTYSTGMSARLSFAIATASEPEVLIIDEVLGTGDGYFAWKAYKRMQEFCSRGRALLFVSHSISAVQQMCDRVVWVQNGNIRLAGEVGYVLRQYELDYKKSEDEIQRSKRISSVKLIQSQVSPDELVGDNQVRFRIVPASRGHFFATHYVRSVKVTCGKLEAISLPLEVAAIDSADVAGALDVLSSEWGRIHERGGHVCRILTRVTGRNRGGQFVARTPTVDGGRLPVSIELEAQSSDQREKLLVEMLDIESGSWQPLELSSVVSAGKGWCRHSFEGSVRVVEPKIAKEAAAKVLEAGLPDVEIVDILVVVDGEQTFQVSERKPFEVQVHLNFYRALPLVDVGLKLTRMDGVYTFWQSSGMAGANLHEPIGRRIVKFIFSPNMFGSGEYFINAHVTDGWKYPENYPYAQVFARVVNSRSFRVMPELAEVDFGVVNQRVSVVVE
jgi:lipopolysaccharide transport system ATP-binding protein